MRLTVFAIYFLLLLVSSKVAESITLQLKESKGERGSITFCMPNVPPNLFWSLVKACCSEDRENNPPDEVIKLCENSRSITFPFTNGVRRDSFHANRLAVNVSYVLLLDAYNL